MARDSRFRTRRRVLGGLATLPWLPATTGAALPPDLIRTLIDTPRQRLTVELGTAIRQGLQPAGLALALQQAAALTLNPRPVGFDFHAAMMVESAVTISRHAGATAGWAPLLWNADYFKLVQDRAGRRGTLALPATPKPLSRRGVTTRYLTAALDAWDETATDSAIAALASEHPPAELLRLLLPYAARDFHSIGHKAIYFDAISLLLDEPHWRAEPRLLRALAYALLARGRVAADQDDWFLRDYRHNLKRLAQPPAQARRDVPSAPELPWLLVDWVAQDQAGTLAERLLPLLPDPALRAPLWDGLMLAAAELHWRHPSVAMLHCVTGTGALRNLHDRTTSADTQALLVLQTASFLVGMREARHEFAFQPDRLRQLSPAADATLPAVTDAFGRSRNDAARRSLGYLQSDGDLDALIRACYPLLAERGDNFHTYKFGARALRDVTRLAPPLRPHYFAAISILLPGDQTPPTDEAQWVREQRLPAYKAF